MGMEVQIPGVDATSLFCKVLLAKSQIRVKRHLGAAFSCKAYIEYSRRHFQYYSKVLVGHKGPRMVSECCC